MDVSVELAHHWKRCFEQRFGSFDNSKGKAPVLEAAAQLNSSDGKILPSFSICVTITRAVGRGHAFTTTAHSPVACDSIGADCVALAKGELGTCTHCEVLW